MATTQTSNPTSGAPFPTSATAGAAADAVHSPTSTQPAATDNAGGTGQSRGGNGGTSSNSSNSGIDAEGGKAGDVMNHVVQMAHETIDKLAERAAPKVQRIQDGVAQTNQLLHDRADNLRDMGDEWTDTLRCTVRDNPLTALAAAAAVGMLMAYLMRSSD